MKGPRNDRPGPDQRLGAWEPGQGTGGVIDDGRRQGGLFRVFAARRAARRIAGAGPLFRRTQRTRISVSCAVIGICSSSSPKNSTPGVK